MSTAMKSTAPNADHLAFRRALEDCIAQHGAKLSALEMLALVSHLVGQLVALQDQRTMTTDMAMDVVVANLKVGNAEVVDRLLHETGGHA